MMLRIRRSDDGGKDQQNNGLFRMGQASVNQAQGAGAVDSTGGQWAAW
jgi:hypothetical protein